MPDLIERFTEGDCHVLACAIHELTGWPVATFVHSWDGSPCEHAFVIHPSGAWLDIEGLRPEAEFREKWSSALKIKVWGTPAALREADDNWDAENVCWDDTPLVVYDAAKALIADVA